MKVFLVLEDGTVFEGTNIGPAREVISETMSSTSMTGYLEVLTDPSYTGQAVAVTYPSIGNYGVCHKDMESKKPQPDGYVVRELSRISSNFRSKDTIQHFLETNDMPGIGDIGTRTLTKILKEKDTVDGMVTTNEDSDVAEATAHMESYVVIGVVKATPCEELYVLEPVVADAEAKSIYTAEKTESLKTQAGRGRWVTLLDPGAKSNTAQSLIERGCEVAVYPSHTMVEEVLNTNPDDITSPNGPRDPKESVGVISEIRKLYESDVPIFAICLGYQLMALAMGADTYKLKYGHRGGNHPAKDLETGKVYISSQNHGYAVDMNSLDPKAAVPVFVSISDSTNEGLKYAGKNILIVQYRSEACPGPQDSSYLFDRFLNMIEVNA